MLTVSKTRSVKMHRFFTLKAKHNETKFQKVLIGKDQNIRSNDISGMINISELAQNITIDGCDWRGALSIWYYLNPYHESIGNNGIYYFMMPPDAILDISGNDNVVFFAFFHHLYNIFLTKEPWTTPPFRTSIEEKYAYLQTVLTNNEKIFDETDDTLNSLLNIIQSSLKKYPYRSWLDIRNLIMNPWSIEQKPIVYDNSYRIGLLETEFVNPEQIIKYLESPIDQFISPPNLDVKYNGSLKKYICEQLLKKIDQQTIFLKTGVAPLNVDWLKELDFFLFRLSRDGI